MLMKILIINGPNLNLLGTREKEVYGERMFVDYLDELSQRFASRDVELDYFQSNVEGEMINALHDACCKYDGVVLNAGGYTHTSVALADAVGAVAGSMLRTVEVHISCIYSREKYRHISLIAPKCMGSVMGFGLDSYRLGIEAFLTQ